ncbi:MAG: hypothetical protein OEZ34_02115, partial [Spirochaetia bacterium]|nr:hypothetical protein [Spirochaetia bacterium]
MNSTAGRVFFLILLFFFSGCKKEQEASGILLIQEKSVSIKLNSHSEIFLDDSSQLKFEDILNPEIQSRFRKNTEGKT